MDGRIKRSAALLLLALTLMGCAPALRTRPSGAVPTVMPVTGTAAVTESAGPRTAAPANPPATPSAPVRTDGQALLDAFRAIAFTSEYPADKNEPGRIRKWAAPIRLAVHGSPTHDDGKALGDAMDGLNAVEGFPGISIVTKDANADIWFVKLERMNDIVPGYVEGNWGFFTVTYGDGGTITRSTVAIATDVTDQPARTHLIHEELLQSTGLMQDEYADPESIFYGNWTTTPAPTRMDWELLRMLYRPELKPGMTEKEAMAALRKIGA